MKKKIVLTILFLYVCTCYAVVGYAGKAPKYKDYTLAPLPDWTDKYADSNKGDMSFFMMSKLVKQLNISWLQAVELQNHFRDLTALGKSSKKAFNKALSMVRSNQFQSGLDPSKVASAPFIVAIDMDETLLQQYYTKWQEGSQYYDYKITFPDGSVRGISMAPGWQILIKTIKKLGGLVIIYSANADQTVWKIVRTVEIDEQKLYRYVDGVMTNNYLIRQGKYEWMLSGKTGTPVIIPSKDLRFFDKTLAKVIIIDDNPKRIIQNICLRLPKKYEADLYYSDKLAAFLYDKQLPNIAGEIEESFNYARDHDISFARAYLPYTQMGNVTMHWLVENCFMTIKGAIQYIRKNPDYVDLKF
jgi:NLI interacting factor-like phosphatase